MFRDVPGCSRMFRDVPCSGFYRRPKKISASLVDLKCFIEIVYDKWCLDESVGQTENGLEGDFVEYGLKSV